MAVHGVRVVLGSVGAAAWTMVLVSAVSLQVAADSSAPPGPDGSPAAVPGDTTSGGWTALLGASARGHDQAGSRPAASDPR